MAHIHSQATAINIEMAASFLTEDIVNLLIERGIKQNSKLIRDVKELKNYEYKKNETGT